MGLAADDAQVKRLRDAAIAGEIVGQHRFLEPIDVVVLELAAHLDRDVRAPALVHVDHNVDVPPDRRAHAPHVGKVGRKVVHMGDLHLDRLEALRTRFARLSLSESDPGADLESPSACCP